MSQNVNVFILLVVSLFLTACKLGSHYDRVESTLYIDYFKEPCSDTSTDLCLRTRVGEDGSYSVETVPMMGFDALKLGVRYKVQVESERDSRGDVSSHTFLSIDSSEDVVPVVSDFVLTISTSSGILLDNSSDGLGTEWILARENTFTCEPADCIAISSAVSSNQKIQLSFRIESNVLKLYTVKCAATDADFDELCEGIKDNSWDIAHYKTDCGLFFPSWCHVYKETAESTDDWKLLPIDIQEFTDSQYQWGTQYDISVSTVIKAGGLESAIFKTDNERAEVTTSFKFVMRTGSDLDKSDNGLLTYLATEFDCERNNLCYKMDQIIAANDDRILILKGKVELSDPDTTSETGSGQALEATINDSLNSRVVLESLVCDAKADKFNADCVDKEEDVYWVNKR